MDGELLTIRQPGVADQARKHPNLQLVTVSPGNTQGTEIASSMAAPVRILMQYILMPIVAPLLGLAHSLQTGAGRIVTGLTDPSLESGAFYATAEKKLTGPVVNQAEIFPDLATPLSSSTRMRPFTSFYDLALARCGDRSQTVSIIFRIVDNKELDIKKPKCGVGASGKSVYRALDQQPES